MSRAARRPAARRAPAKRKAARRQPWLDRLLLALPVSPRALQQGVAVGLFSLALVGLAGFSTLFGVPQAAGQAVGDLLGRAGMRVASIEINGVEHLDRTEISKEILDQRERALPLVDLAAIRARLLKYPWVADAQVGRRLPDRLVVTIVERHPVAVWQQQGRLQLIDAAGAPIAGIGPREVRDLPLLIGDGANFQTRGFEELVAATPGLRPRVKAGRWVGNRRWDLMFASGETLELPEEAPAAALAKFARLDRDKHLLGRGWLRFDLRDPERIVARRPAPAALPAAPPATAAAAPRGEG